MAKLSDEEITKIMVFVDRLVSEVDESCSMLLGKGLERSQEWDEKLSWKIPVEFEKLRDIQGIVKKWNTWDEDEGE